MAEQQQTAEATKQCVACKKPAKKLRRYYRDGKYYCSKNCYRKFKAAKTSAGPSA